MVHTADGDTPVPGAWVRRCLAFRTVTPRRSYLPILWPGSLPSVTGLRGSQPEVFSPQDDAFELPETLRMRSNCVIDDHECILY